MNIFKKQFFCLLISPILLVSQQPICGNHKSLDIMNNLDHISPNELNREVGGLYDFTVLNFEVDTSNVVDTLSFFFYKNEEDVNIFIEESEFNNSSAEAVAIDYIIDAFINYTPDAQNGYQSGIKNAEELILGPPPEISNNSEVNILFLNIRYQANENIYKAGFFTPNDQRHCFEITPPYTPLYSHWTKSKCLSNNGGWWPTPSSNDGNFIYIDIEHFPLSINNVDIHLKTIAHEYQHLLHFNSDRYESFPLFLDQTEGHNPWLNEGISELMSSILGFGQRDYSPFLGSPNIGLDEWATLDSGVLPYYAKSALFFQYLYELEGLGMIGEIFNSTEQGITSIKSIFGNEYFEWLYINWIQSLLLGELVTTQLNSEVYSENIENYISMGLQTTSIGIEKAMPKYSFTLFSAPEYLSTISVDSNSELNISLFSGDTLFNSENIIDNGMNNVDKIIVYSKDYESDDIMFDISYRYILSPDQKNLFVYPNPITGNILSYTYFGDQNSHTIFIKLFNLNGRIVLTKEIIADTYGNYNGNLSFNLSSGIYIFQSLLDSGVSESRLITIIK